MKALFAVLLSLLFANESIAAESRVTPDYQACVSKASGHWDSYQCVADEVDRQKALLNIDYKALVRQTDKRDLAALQKAQKAWLTFRELECTAKSDAVTHGGGNGAPDAEASCLLNHILIRRNQMKGYWSF